MDYMAQITPIFEDDQVIFSGDLQDRVQVDTLK